MSRRPRAGAGGIRLAWRGLWFRKSTALIVLVLATVASAASVVAPLYSRAAEESILRNTLNRADAFTLSVQVSVPFSGAGAGFGAAHDGNFTLDKVHQELTHPAFGEPRLSYVAQGQYRPTAGPFKNADVVGQVVERDGICENLEVVAGRCATAKDEAIVARRSMALIGADIGDTVDISLQGTATVQSDKPPGVSVKIVGTFDPVPVESHYWAGRQYFSQYFPRSAVRQLVSVPPTADPIFVGPGTAKAANITTYTVDVPLIPSKVRIDDPDTLRKQVRRLSDTVIEYELTPDSKLPDALARADEGRELVRIAAPLAVTQLVLLSWWTLYLVVGSATEERSPELGLAKLRGLTARQTRRFGLAEIVILLLVAAPLGTVLGFLAVRGSAGQFFAPGTQVLMTWSVLLTVLFALAGGVVTASLSSRQVFRRPVSELLRRVPPRRAGRRAGLVDGVVLVLAIAGVVQLISDRGGRPSPVALLAPGMVAVAGGLLAARMLVRVARRRSARAMARGRAASMAGWASVARRPGTARIASVLAVATCLLLVGVQAWAVAERNRVERSAAETGAAVVLQVRAPSSGKLLSAVRAADPSGGYAMAAVQVTSSGQEPSLVAVDATRADRIVDFGSPEAKPSGQLQRTLRPSLPPPIELQPGTLRVTADLQELESPSPLRLSARVEDSDNSTRVDLGEMRPGSRTYSGELPATCADDCRLAALAVSHPGTDLENATATLSIDSIELVTEGSSEPKTLSTDFATPRAWRPGAPSVGGPEVRIRPGETLRVEVRAPGGPMAEIVHGDAPEPVPALTGSGAGGTPEEEGGIPIAETTGLSGTSMRYLTNHPADFVPRAGPDAVLVDLGIALLQSPNPPLGDRQVWLSRDDPSDEKVLRDKLAEADIAVLSRESQSDLERVYAGDGAVLALRLLLVCGSAAVVVAVGALLVAAYVGRRQRAYEVAALRVVGLRRRSVRTLLLLENVGTVLVALVCGALAAGIATWVVLPALPQFDTTSQLVDVRYAPDFTAFAASIAGLGLLLVAVGLAVAALQLRTGRSDRLREGVR